MRATRALLLGLGLTLAWALPASASNWAAPTVLSSAGAQVNAAPSVAIDDAGFGVVAWAEIIAGKSVVQVAQHAPGGSWTTVSTPIASSIPLDACTPYASIDARGNALVVWAEWDGGGCDGGNQTILFSTRTGGSGTWSAPGVVGSAAPAGDWDLRASSNSNGQMVVGWETTSGANNLVFGAVGSPTGGFIAPTTLTSLPATANYLSYLTTAIGPSGDAAVQWNVNDSTNSNVVIAIKTPTGNFPTTPTPVTAVTAPKVANAGTVAIDAAGDVLSTYLFYDGTSSAPTSRYRPAGGAFATQLAIAAVTPGFSTSWIAVGVDGTGNATATWVEVNYSTPSPHTSRLFAASRPAGAGSVWTSSPPLTDAVASTDANASIGVSTAGTVAITWDVTAAEEDAIAFYRTPGGPFGSAVNLGQGSGTNAIVSPSGDAIVGLRGSLALDARVSVLDVHSPTVTDVNVPSAANAGASVAMTSTATDLWAGIPSGQPIWSFGDGVTATGASTTHTYLKAGTYTVTLTLSDGAANAAAPTTRTITVAAAPVNPPTGPGPSTPLPKATIAKPKLKAAYVASKLVGTVALAGTSAKAGKLQIVIRRRGAKKTAATVHITVKAGKWSKTITLSSSLVPGTYGVTIGGTGFSGSSTSFAIAAPKSGIVNRAYASGPRRGPAAIKLAGTSELWAHFHFGTLPKAGQAITTQWTLPSGKKLAANVRPRTSLVEAQVKDLTGKPLPTGLWRCVVRAGGAVVATVSVRVT